MFISKSGVLTSAILLFVFAFSTFAEEKVELKTQADVITTVPRSMTYQGILKDSDGEGVPDSFFDVAFRLFDDSSSGTQLWSDIVSVGTDANGIFTAELANLNIPFDADYWLEMEIDSEVLTPRQKVNMSAYSARADTADYALASSSGWVDDGVNVRLENSSDNVGIGISAPTNKLHIGGSESDPLLNIDQTGLGQAVQISSTDASALWVEYAGNHGLQVTNADGDGVHIDNAGSHGLQVTNAGGDGVHIDNASNYGIRVSNANNYAGFFQGDVSVTGGLIVDDIVQANDRVLTNRLETY